MVPARKDGKYRKKGDNQNVKERYIRLVIGAVTVDGILEISVGLYDDTIVLDMSYNTVYTFLAGRPTTCLRLTIAARSNVGADACIGPYPKQNKEAHPTLLKSNDVLPVFASSGFSSPSQNREFIFSLMAFMKMGLRNIPQPQWLGIIQKSSGTGR